MNEFDDQELDRPTAGSPVLDDSEGEGRWLRVVIAALVVLAVIAGAYFWLVHRGKAGPPSTASSAGLDAAEKAPAATQTPDETVVDPTLPPLDASDEWVRGLAQTLSDNPQLARWLGVSDVIRRFAAAVDNIAEGTNPASHLGFLRPKEGFKVREKNGLPHIDPASYRRYDRLTETFASLDPAEAAALYQRLKPLIADAYRDLGYPDRDFDETLARAIRRLRSTPIPEGDIPLTPRVVTYAYSDADLESLSPAQRALLRTGPDNTRRIQAQLGELETALGL